jgi:hypothetical protein
MDLATVDSLARLQLAGRRLGFRVRLSAPRELWELIDLVGLREVIGKIEEREETLRVEEEGELGDPPVRHL